MTLRALIRSDLERFTQTFSLRGQPYSRTRVLLESVLFKAGFQAVLLYRLSHWCHQHRWTYVAWSLARLNIAVTGAEIEYNASIGPGLFVAHPVGIVIGRGTRIGRGATLFQGVTCGVRSWHPDAITKFPTIGDDCCLFAQATILGGVTLGDECVVAAHAVVTTDVPAGAMARGIPAEIVPGAGARARRDWMGAS